ncbi:putative nuclease HARBI1 [Brienomyrus brachyistius]|uniref:putative nuclease HARBI1 n=1 Tax=Brienomyrus brachyistius TaxID=42636 RepID=UPI0020B1D541|nr:putative nuclease HARBI1 [Brienomyrus brachyistius]
MAYLALLEDIARSQIRRERVFRDRSDFFSNDDWWLISRFRLPRAILMELCNELAPTLERPTSRNHAVPVQLQVLTTLGFLATGTYQRELADRSGISQPTMSSFIPQVVAGINRLSSQHIKFPCGVDVQANIKTQFAAMSGFPNVIGAIDCTHIAIKAPSENEATFLNKKQFYSINVQLICDANMVLTNVVARWPGSTHDALILQKSSVGRSLEAGVLQDGWLIGDSAYPLKPWLLTPFYHPCSEEERRFNEAHGVAHSVIERTICCMKKRWRCLDRSGGVLIYHPTKVCNIVIACCVLHNLAQRHNLPLPEPLNIEMDDIAVEPLPEPADLSAVRLRVDVCKRM